MLSFLNKGKLNINVHINISIDKLSSLEKNLAWLFLTPLHPQVQ